MIQLFSKNGSERKPTLLSHFNILLWLQIVLTLEKYGVKNIVGIPFGYRGFFEKGLSEILVRTSTFCLLNGDLDGHTLYQYSELFLHFQLSRQVVENINLAGGSLLGVSRGGAEISEIVDSIQVRI